MPDNDDIFDLDGEEKATQEEIERERNRFLNNFRRTFEPSHAQEILNWIFKITGIFQTCHDERQEGRRDVGIEVLDIFRESFDIDEFTILRKGFDYDKRH